MSELIQEIRSYLLYTHAHQKLYFWRTSTGQEVDLIVGQMDLAIEFKAKSMVSDADLKGLLALRQDQNVKQAIAVTLDEKPRELPSGIRILPWPLFCKGLWKGQLISLTKDYSRI